MLANPGAAAGLVYGTARALWHDQQFAKAFPAAKSYRHSLPEEEDALTHVVMVYRELRAKDPKVQDPSLDLLATMKDDGMLAPFVLLTHADNGIAEDYGAYRDGHRGQLIAFIDRYLVPPAP